MKHVGENGSALLCSELDKRFYDLGTYEENVKQCKENPNYFKMYAILSNNVAVEIRNEDDYQQIVKLSFKSPFQIVSACESSHADFVKCLFEKESISSSLDERSWYGVIFLSTSIIGCLFFCSWIHYR